MEMTGIDKALKCSIATAMKNYSLIYHIQNDRKHSCVCVCACLTQQMRYLLLLEWRMLKTALHDFSRSSLSPLFLSETSWVVTVKFHTKWQIEVYMHLQVCKFKILFVKKNVEKVQKLDVCALQVSLSITNFIFLPKPVLSNVTHYLPVWVCCNLDYICPISVKEKCC